MIQSCCSFLAGVRHKGGTATVSYLSHDVGLTAGVTVLLQTARVARRSSAVRHLVGRVADRQAALEVHCELRQALRDGACATNRKINNKLSV